MKMVQMGDMQSDTSMVESRLLFYEYKMPCLLLPWHLMMT